MAFYYLGKRHVTHKDGGILAQSVGINSNLVMNKLIPTIIRGATAGDMDE